MENLYRIFLSISLLIWSFSVHAEERDIKYHYDELGQLTFVEDSVNGNRDYDYDDAGNRELVSVGQSTDDVPLPPPPAAPTGLYCSLQAPNVYRASWNASSGASYYIVRSTGSTNPEHKVTSTSYYIDEGGATCKWVKACNSSDICSDSTNF